MAYFDIAFGSVGYVGAVAISHMTKALELLQADLAKIDRATAEVTISTIIAFSMVAFISGDFDSSGKHLHGLFKVLNMRGGLGSLKTCTYLQIKCCRLVSKHLAQFNFSFHSLYPRLDLSYAMCTSSKPLFFTANNISWKSYLPKSTPVPWMTTVNFLVGDLNTDSKMVNIWHDLHEFSRAANIATQTNRKLEPDLLQEVMISVQYRLLNLQYENKDAHELIRVVMLAYSITILPLLFSHFTPTPPINYPSLQIWLQRFLIIAKESSNEKLKALLWILVVVGITIMDNEPINLQLTHIMQALNLNSWDEVLEILKGFLWVDVLHGERGKKLFNNTIMRTERVINC
jgi:hypothetical protein